MHCYHFYKNVKYITTNKPISLGNYKSRGIKLPDPRGAIPTATKYTAVFMAPGVNRLILVTAQCCLQLVKSLSRLKGSSI